MVDYDREQMQSFPMTMRTKQRDMGDGTHAPVVAVGAGSESPWAIQYPANIAPNSSDKVLPVTAGMMWHILAIRVELTTDANVGNRQLVVEFRDTADNVLWEVRAGLTQAGGLTYMYNFGASMADMDAVRDTDWVSTPIPPTMIIGDGSDVRVRDNNAVSAAGDDMIVRVIVAERAA